MKRLRSLKNSKKIRRGLTAAIAFLAAALVIVLIVGRANRVSGLPMPYSNEKMVYLSTDQAAMKTDSSFASGLCTGEANVSNSKIKLAGTTEHAALFSVDDRSVFFAKGMYTKIYPASITKIMTAILALKNGNMDDVVTINYQDVELESGSQVVGFKAGDKVKMSELLRGLLIHSGNDCAQAIARHIGGTQEKFVEMMNEEAKSLGCTGTHFVNPTGLHDDNHYTTVYDIYLMLNKAVTYPDFLNITQTSVYDLTYTSAAGKETHVTLDSTDHFLTGEVDPPKNVTVLGGKTGTTDKAGNCLAIEAQNAYGEPYFSIVVGAKSKDILYEDQYSMLSQINS